MAGPSRAHAAPPPAPKVSILQAASRDNRRNQIARDRAAADRAATSDARYVRARATSSAFASRATLHPLRETPPALLGLLPTDRLRSALRIRRRRNLVFHFEAHFAHRRHQGIASIRSIARARSKCASPRGISLPCGRDGLDDIVFLAAAVRLGRRASLILLLLELSLRDGSGCVRFK